MNRSQSIEQQDIESKRRAAKILSDSPFIIRHSLFDILVRQDKPDFSISLKGS